MHEFLLDKCELIEGSINTIEKYTKNIFTAEDFKKDETGLLYLDACMMRLQVIGENIKKINKIQPDFFITTIRFDVNNIIRFRDLISHHYEKLDSDIIFDVCKNDIPLLKQKIIQFLNSQ
jgi:uncharacterized protein with HEPN domain